MDVIVASLHKANEIIQAQDLGVLLSDLNVDREGDGLEVLKSVRKVNPESVVPPYRLPAYRLPTF